MNSKWIPSNPEGAIVERTLPDVGQARTKQQFTNGEAIPSGQEPSEKFLTRVFFIGSFAW